MPDKSSDKCNFPKLLGSLALLFLACNVANAEKYDPCCSFPCQNRGICNTVEEYEDFHCDCTRTGHYGNTCEIPLWGTTIRNFVNSLQITQRISKSKILGGFINRVEFFRKRILKMAVKGYALDPPYPEPFNHFADYTTWEGYNNKTYYSRTLPPVPKNCPTPMGVAGPKNLPNATKVIEEVFLRDKFIPTLDDTSLLLPVFGQFFTHNGFKSLDFSEGTTWRSHKLDLNNIYGASKHDQNALRALSGGKLKTQSINGEMFPPSVEEVPYLEVNENDDRPNKSRARFALAHPFYSLFPTLTFWSTLYIREHNRICGVLKEVHPTWDDERLYQTTRLIMIAINLKIIVEDYIQQISHSEIQGWYNPELIHDEPVSWGASSISTEFNSMYLFHQGIPDEVIIQGKAHNMTQLINNYDILPNIGMKKFVESIASQPCGSISGGKNLNKFFVPFWAKRLENHRKLRTQSFNQFRKYFGLKPYTSFEDLAGNSGTARTLKKLYTDIDAVEYFVGILAERPLPNKLFGITHTLSIAHFAYRNVFSNIIGSPSYYKPSTFGGDVGFDLVKNTRLQDLLCRNIEGCPKLSFKVSKNTVNVVKRNEL